MIVSRQKAILGILAENQLATVDELSMRLGVSEATVRRDLMSLENRGLIDRMWGGATPKSSVAFEPFVHERSRNHQAEKQAIARAAVEMVNEGEVIALDVGSTCTEVAKLLIRFRRITVFTNSLLTAQILGNASFSVHMLGGRIRTGEFSLVGPVARENVRRFHYDKFFMGVSGFDLKHGPTDYNLDDVEIKQCFLERAKQRIALVDHSKFGHVSLAAICGVDALTDVISDGDMASEHREELERQGIHITVADVDDEAAGK